MRKLLGLALLPVVAATSVGMACAEYGSSHAAQTQSDITSNTVSTKTVKTQKNTPVARTNKNGAFSSVAVSKLQKRLVVGSQLNQTWVTAQSNLISRHYPEAIDAFQSILAVEPNNVNALEGLAMSYQAQGRYAEALQQINRAIALDPVNSRLFLTKGQILDADGRSLEAVDSYLTFTSQTPDDGAALMTARRVDELYKVVEPSLTDSSSNYLQGLRMLSIQQPAQAIPFFAKYQTLEPDSEKAYILLGQAYLEAGQPDLAIQQLDMALKVQNDNPLAYYQLGSSYEMKGESKSAAEAFRKFLQFAPQSEAALNINRRFELNQQ